SIEAIAAFGLEGSGAVRGEIFEGSERSLLERVRAGRPQLAHSEKDAATASRDLFVAGAGDALFVFACAAGGRDQVRVWIHEAWQDHAPAQVEFFRAAILSVSGHKPFNL